jgi:hypothetical protein
MGYPQADTLTRAPERRFPSLEAFGRRPRCQRHRPCWPSSPTLHKTGTLLPCLHSASIGAAITPAPNMLRTPWKNPSLSRPHRPRLRPSNDPWKLRTGMSFDREIVALLRTSKSRELTPRGVRRSASTKGRHSLRPCLPEKKKFPLTATVAPATRCGPRRLASARLRRRINLRSTARRFSLILPGRRICSTC